MKRTARIEVLTQNPELEGHLCMSRRVLHGGSNVQFQHPFAIEGLVGFCQYLLVALEVFLLFANDHGLYYRLSNGAVFQEVAHLGKHIGHFACLESGQKMCFWTALYM